MLYSVAVGGSSSSAEMSGVYVKVDRAKAHLKEFDTQSRPIINACKQALKRAYDGKQSEYVIRLDPVPDVPSVLSAIIGDAIHNLRVSLDHLAWQLVIAAEETLTEIQAFRSGRHSRVLMTLVFPCPISNRVSRRTCEGFSMKSSHTSERDRRIMTLLRFIISILATSIISCLSRFSASTITLSDGGVTLP